MHTRHPRLVSMCVAGLVLLAAAGADAQPVDDAARGRGGPASGVVYASVRLCQAAWANVAMKVGRRPADASARAWYASEYKKLLLADQAAGRAEETLALGRHAVAFDLLYASLVRQIIVGPKDLRPRTPWTITVLHRAYDAWADNVGRYRAAGPAAVEPHWRAYFALADSLDRGGAEAWRSGRYARLQAAGAAAFFTGDLPRALHAALARTEPAVARDLEADWRDLDATFTEADDGWAGHVAAVLDPRGSRPELAGMIGPGWTAGAATIGERRAAAWAQAAGAGPLVATAPPPKEGPNRVCPDPATMPADWKVREVKVGGGGDPSRFAPAALTVTQGDLVRFLAFSAAPHSIAFLPDDHDVDTRAQLSANLENPTGGLVSPVQFKAFGSVDISLGGVPPGRYRYYCTVHGPAALGVITVTRPASR